MKLFKKKKKKAQLGIGQIATVAIVLVVAGITIALGLQVMGDVQGDLTPDSSEYNATGSAIEGTGSLADKLPLIGTVVGAVIVIGLIASAFMGKRR